MGGTIDMDELRRLVAARKTPIVSFDDIRAMVASDAAAKVAAKANRLGKVAGWGQRIPGYVPIVGFAAWLPKASDSPVNFYGVSRGPMMPRTLLAFSGKIDLRMGLR